MKNSLEKWITIFLLSASIFVSVLLSEATILAVTNQFKTIYIYLSLIPAFAVSIFFYPFIKKDVRVLPKVTLPLLLLIFLVSLIMIVYPHDNFGGSDQASYINHASYLVKSASLNLPSYLDNVPGVSPKDIKSLPPGYAIFLATQKVFFGIPGLLHSNVIIIILGLFSFFLVSSYFGGNKIGLLATVLFSTSMPFLWFSRETMTENLSLFLLWSLIIFLIIFLRTKNLIYLVHIFICSLLFSMTRYEGFLLQFVLLFVLPTLLFLNRINCRKILIIITIYILIFISNIYINKDGYISPFFTGIFQQVTWSIKRDISTLVPQNLSGNTIKYSMTVTSSETLSSKYPSFIFQMMAKYNFILPIFSIFLIAVLYLVRFRNLDQSKKFFFIILILLIPEYYKLISPNVTLTQPWLYRRYMYALLPFGYLCFSLFLRRLNNRSLLIMLSIIAFIINIVLSGPILFLKNNWLLIDVLNEITKDISQNDLIIIDGSPLGDYHTNSFFVINKGIRIVPSSIVWLQDYFPEKKFFNGVQYNKIFILSAINKNVYASFDIVSRKMGNKIIYASFDIVSRKSVDVEYLQLVGSCQLYVLGSEEGMVNPYNIGALPFSSVEKYCSQPTNEIVKHKGKLYMYELTYTGENN